MPNKDLVNKIQSLGIDAKNHMSRLSEEDVERVRRALAKERQENTVQERVNDTVIRRRSKDGSMLRPQAQNAAPPRHLRPRSSLLHPLCSYGQQRRRPAQRQRPCARRCGNARDACAANHGDSGDTTAEH